MENIKNLVKAIWGIEFNVPYLMKKSYLNFMITESGMDEDDELYNNLINRKFIITKVTDFGQDLSFEYLNRKDNHKFLTRQDDNAIQFIIRYIDDVTGFINRDSDFLEDYLMDEDYLFLYNRELKFLKKVMLGNNLLKYL